MWQTIKDFTFTLFVNRGGAQKVSAVLAKFENLALTLDKATQKIAAEIAAEEAALQAKIDAHNAAVKASADKSAQLSAVKAQAERASANIRNIVS